MALITELYEKVNNLKSKIINSKKETMKLYEMSDDPKEVSNIDKVLRKFFKK